MDTINKDDTISRQAVLTEISRWRGYLNDDMIMRISIGIKRLPSAQPNLQPTCNQLATDCISRQEAIDAVERAKTAMTTADREIYCAKINAQMNIQLLPSAQSEQPSEIQDILNYLDTVLHPIISPEHWSVYSELHDMISMLPTAQSERLTDDDFETIRIHLNAYKEKLCNQRRYDEAEEYQRIIDRFIAFASEQSEIIRCKDCKHIRKWRSEESAKKFGQIYECARDVFLCPNPEDFCSHAERSQPSAQPNIIHCKDCKFSDWYTTVNNERRCYCMEHGSSGHTESDFCSYAESADVRKDEG